jgi:hypothetical protein
MIRAFAAVAAAVGFFGMAVAALPAHAAVDTPGSISVPSGKIEYTWFGTPANGGDCSTNALCANANVVANITNTGIVLTPVAGVLVGAGGDLSLTIMIESLTGAPISSFALTTGGTPSGSTGVNIYGADGFTFLASTTAAVGASNSVALSPATAGTKIFASLDSTASTGSISFVGISVTTVPEPATLAILATGVVGLAGLRRRRAAR